MNLKLIGIGAVVVAIIAVACFVTYYAIENKWWTPWDTDPVEISGSWSEEIILVYADGSTDSLKMLVDRPWPLNVYYDQKQIVEIQYQIYASAIGEGYTTCNIDLSDFTIDTTISNVGYHGTYNIGDYWTDQTCYLPLDGEEVSLGRTALDIDGELAGAVGGGYTVTFTITGSVRYRGENPYPGNWHDADLPSGISIVVDKVEGWVYLNITSTIETE